MALIHDGKGRGYSAAVDATNRLEVSSSTVEEERVSALAGTAFAISTGSVSFTSSTDSAILWVKNTSVSTLICDRVRVMLGTATGGTGDWTIRFVRNGTLGTVVSNALDAGITNVNHGSSVTPTGLFYRGVQGDTLTDGTSAPFPIKTGGDGQVLFEFGRILPTGSTFGIRLQPPAGTTAATAICILRTYYPVAQ